jgi:hypothetical protein
MTQHSELSARAALMDEALREASRLVENLHEKYREQAFPIVLQGLIDGSFATTVPLPPAPGQNGEIPQDTAPLRLQPNLSVNEFFRMVNPTTHVDRFVCAAYYLLHVGQMEQFSMIDILDIYGKLRIKKPQNPSDTLNKCIRKVHIIDATAINGQKSWVITPSGEKYVEDLLNGSAPTKNSAD